MPALTTSVLLAVSAHSGVVGILAAFVAINTVMYAALAVAKMLPKIHPSRWIRQGYLRAETRSIHPDAPAGTRSKHGRDAVRHVHRYDR